MNELVQPARRDRMIVLRSARAIGAVSLLVAGAVHLQQYTVDHYSVVPTIGSLFLLNFIAATIVGLILLTPIGASVGRTRLRFDAAAAVIGISVALGAFVALVISEHTPLFGFREYNYREVIVIALVSEAIAVVSLAVFVARAAGLGRVSATPRPEPA
jgi:nucleoside recognition membrane protein YjiH